jgi:hypothetical protein
MRFASLAACMVAKSFRVLLASSLACTAPRAVEDRTAGGEHGSFAFVSGADTTLVDSYSRTVNVLTGVVQPRVSGARFGWARYRVEFSARYDTTRVVMVLGKAGTSPESLTADTFRTVITMDSIIEQWPNRAATRVVGEHGTIPFFPPSIAMFEEVLRRAHTQRSQAGEMRIPVYQLLSGGATDHVAVSSLAPDSAVVRSQGSRPARYEVDRPGRILSGVAEGNLRTVRLR